ncbi:MAG: cation transporter [Actinobacteria bacterium]|nr:cation transporter [Actinomycetota bacterium]
MADVKEIRVNTTGLHCRSCSMMVDMTLGELSGVEESQTDHATGVTDVRFDAEVLGADEIIAAIREAGYDAELSE